MGEKLKIEYVKRASLKADARNSRIHSDEQIEGVVQSIKQFGWTNPILIDEDRSIIAGHARCMAAERMGLEVVPVITLAGLSLSQKRAYLIADNKLALNSDWDYAVLGNELSALLQEGVDLRLLGFTAGEADEIMLGWESDIETVVKGELEGPPDKLSIVLEDSRDMTKAKQAIRKALEEKKVGFSFK
jgi:ParB-like chromosome segregation protein Spo0J